MVFYNRANEAGALLKPGDFDWPSILAGGVRWFHSGGIFAALVGDHLGTDHRGDAGRQARRRDGFVRPELPAQAMGLRRRCRTRPARVLTRIVDNVDALIGNEEDLQKGLGIAGPDVALARISIRTPSS